MRVEEVEWRALRDRKRDSAVGHLSLRARSVRCWQLDTLWNLVGTREFRVSNHMRLVPLHFSRQGAIVHAATTQPKPIARRLHVLVHEPVAPHLHRAEWQRQHNQRSCARLSVHQVAPTAGGESNLPQTDGIYDVYLPAVCGGAVRREVAVDPSTRNGGTPRSVSRAAPGPTKEVRVAGGWALVQGEVVVTRLRRKRRDVNVEVQPGGRIHGKPPGRAVVVWANEQQ